jgi:hypothetical protein
VTGELAAKNRGPAGRQPPCNRPQLERRSAQPVDQQNPDAVAGPKQASIYAPHATSRRYAAQLPASPNADNIESPNVAIGNVTFS